MNRILATVLLCLSMLSIADGGLLRPCGCSSGDVPPCGACPATASAADSKCCCCCDEPAMDESGDEPVGCTICPGPREPREVAPSAVALSAPTPGFLDEPQILVVRYEDRCVLGERPAATPADGPWRSSPEGLSVFLT